MSSSFQSIAPTWMNYNYYYTKGKEELQVFTAAPPVELEWELLSTSSRPSSTKANTVHIIIRVVQSPAAMLWWLLCYVISRQIIFDSLWNRTDTQLLLMPRSTMMTDNVEDVHCKYLITHYDAMTKMMVNCNRNRTTREGMQQRRLLLLRPLLGSCVHYNPTENVQLNWHFFPRLI